MSLYLFCTFFPPFFSCSFFSSWITLSFSCPSSFQRSVGAPSRMSPLVVSCLQATQLHMSTTCTACGPLRLPLEAQSGLNNTLSFLFFCVCVCVFSSLLITLFFSNFLSIYHLSIYFQFSQHFCNGIHHFHRLLCNQSSVSYYWPIVEILLGEGKYHLRASRFYIKESQVFQVNFGLNMYACSLLYLR